MIKTYFLNSQKLPLVAESDNQDKSLKKLSDLAMTQRDFFRAALLRHGAVLLRGFDVRTIDEFERFVRLFSGADFFNYAGGVSPRRALSGGVYTSTEYPPHLALALHNELSYSDVSPRHLYFFCHTAPETGGATTLGDSRQILRNINPKTLGLFKYKRVRYDRNLIDDANSDYSWQAAFETDDKAAVENQCRVISAEFDWKAHGNLRVSQTRPATATHPETGEEVWFNQADGFHPSNLDAETRGWFVENGEDFRLDAHFGDGSPIAASMLEEIRQVLQKETIPHQWQASDILILDNMLTAHGRMPFSGARRIALAMT
ncbi:MAG: SyrP-like protein [uncultured Pyrinomonadaceae bacterium]|uniref:SyrP-like protein n=1 Tax=uncultured Pyrinomonadaceae bacterium TaxID=2283094 RepID=A0A6J4PQB0_9BACT|nr:MAG: SyrP-like protein [uncultured Pyrinomonadaceae bacterium]